MHPALFCCDNLACDRDAGGFGYRRILNDKRAAHGSEGLFDLGEVGAGSWGRGASDSAFFKTELLAQCLFGNSLFSHRRIDSELGGD